MFLLTTVFHQTKSILENFFYIFYKNIVEEFFFLIGNIKFLLKIKLTRVHWGCTMGLQTRNQNYNDQVKQEEKYYRGFRYVK